MKKTIPGYLQNTVKLDHLKTDREFEIYASAVKNTCAAVLSILCSDGVSSTVEDFENLLHQQLEDVDEFVAQVKWECGI